ncbi:helix-turn-helix domain-containing protein [Streptomyces sp. H39-S7]|nr:helix-turn-helix domain-containing protein [Streptomyces sp. H39-S7]MCZ4124997.1 helix-turn-helix domain-containing protein [Streptomyces sp. H39-S7]
MHLRYVFRVCPTPGQRIALARMFGLTRVGRQSLSAPGITPSSVSKVPFA